MRKYLTTILLVATIPLGELHTFWHNDRTVENWIYAHPTPMLIQWNVKFLTNEITPIFYFLAWYFYKPNKINKTTVISFLWLAVFNLFLYFYDFKTGSKFGSVYLWFIGFWLLTAGIKEIANYLWDWIRSVWSSVRDLFRKRKSH